MTLVTLTVRSLARGKLRSALTILAATIGTLAFVFLRSVIQLWYSSVETAQADRLAVRNKTSLTQTLPLAQYRRIASLPGVSAVTFAGWFGGTISDQRKDFFPNFYVDPPTYLDVYDEFVVPPKDRSAWMSDPCGALIGRSLADRFGWKTGDRVTLRGTVIPGQWTLNVRGIFEGRTPTTDTRSLIFPFRCVNERVGHQLKDQVSFFGVRIDDPSRSGAVAAAIDSMFANSAHETRTESERAFRLGFVAMSSAILAAIRIVSYVILAIMLLVVANTIAMSVRDETIELCTLRAIGFKPRHVISLVLGRAMLIGLASAVLGAAATPFVTRLFVRIVAASFGALPRPTLGVGTIAIGTAASVGVAVAAGVIPAIQAVRLSVAEGLRRVA